MTSSLLDARPRTLAISLPDTVSDRFDGEGVARAALFHRPGKDDAHSLLDRELARRRFVQRLGRPDAERAADGAAIVRADEAGAFERALHHRLERAIERGIAGRVLQVGDDDRHRIVRGRRDQRARIPPAAADQRDGQRNHGRQRLHADDAFDGDRRARIVEAIEISFELGRRLITLVRIGIEAARDQRVERFRDVRSDGACRRRRPLHPGFQLGDRAFARRAPRAADEQVVQNQAERVDVRTLIDRAPLACSGAMYSTVPTMPSSVTPVTMPVAAS